MTTQPNLIALAARCEAAEGADRELDEAIREVVWTFRSEHGESGHLYTWWEPKPDVALVADADAPRFTASLDAAMSLVPEGCVFKVMTDFGLPGRATVYGEVPIGAVPDRGFQADAATPALALCAAALRAREQGATHDD